MNGSLLRDAPWKCEGCGWTNLGYVPECDGCGERKTTALLSRSGALAEIERLRSIISELLVNTERPPDSVFEEFRRLHGV